MRGKREKEIRTKKRGGEEERKEEAEGPGGLTPS